MEKDKLIVELDRIKKELNQSNINFNYKYNYLYNTFELSVDKTYYLDGFLLEFLEWTNIIKIIKDLLYLYEYSKDIFIIRGTGGLWNQLQNANIMHYKALTQKDFEDCVEKIFKTKY